MRLTRFLAVACWAACSSISFTQSVAPSPVVVPGSELPNLADIVLLLTRYHDYGQYDFEIRRVAEAAREYLDRRTNEHKPTDKLAAVFDIDETSLSNWPIMLDCGFCSYKAQTKLYPNYASDPPITPVLDLYNYARSKGVAVFFITGRQESARTYTEENLKTAGYESWVDLIMQPNGNKETAGIFKPRDRAGIVQKGYTIIINIGDQASDLVGCCAERSFKLPNPFYLVP